MNKTVAITISFILIASVAIAGEIRKEGKCVIKEALGRIDRKNVFPIDLSNSDIKVSIKARSGKFFGQLALFAIPFVTNLTDKKLDVSFHAVFFGADDRFIACISEDREVPKRVKDYQFAGCLRKVPKTSIDKIKSYRIIIYTSESKPK